MNTATETPAAPTITRLQSTQDANGMGNNVRRVEGAAYERYVSPRNPGPNPNAVHPWERVGLGVAPYRCVGTAVVTYQACRDAPVQPGTCCDYCGQGIMNAYSVQAACKSVFKVGCDCVGKTCSEKEGVRTTIETADRKRRNAQAKVARDKRDAVAQATLKSIRAEHSSRLSSLPHPRGAEQWAADLTALDWYDFMLKCCGATGRAKLLKDVRAMLAAH